MGRGLSSVQKRIMEEAGKGFITPHEAVELAMENVSWKGDAIRTASAIASRSLRRLVTRGLLIKMPARYRKQASVYRLKEWVGCMPWVDSKQVMNADYGVAPLPAGW